VSEHDEWLVWAVSTSSGCGEVEALSGLYGSAERAFDAVANEVGYNVQEWTAFALPGKAPHYYSGWSDEHTRLVFIHRQRVEE